MAKKKVGTLIREARAAAGLTQEQLAQKISGLSASEISKAERGEKELTQDELKQIAKLTGVTQKSLLEAAAPAKKTASKADSATKKASASGAASDTTKKASASKTSSSTAKKTTPAKTSSASRKTSGGTSVRLSATEKRMIELYRAADADTRKAAEALLRGKREENGGIVDALLNGAFDLLGALGRR